MLLDVLHAVLKLTRSTPLTAAMQIASRIYLLIDYDTCSNSPIFKVMVLAWSCAETLRFFYYEFHQLHWLRYSAFIVLYPIGVFAGELPLIWFHWQ